MTYLIDGYNLMHAVGLLGPRSPAGGLERARTRLLDWLADTTAGRDCTFWVIFDGRGSPAPSRETTHRGVWVRFAFRQTADELIETWLAAEPRPNRVTVVSNDNQVRNAARRYGSAAHSCMQFVDWCITPPNRPASSNSGDSARVPTAEKPEPTASPEEIASWLAVFTQPQPKRRKG